MKHVSEVTACVIDYGSFISVAEKLAETMEKVYYYSPYEQEFQDLRKCIIGDGLDRVTRLDAFLDPEVFDTIDLFVFPDIGFGGLQKHLRALGKAVWGSFGASDLELYRTYFLDVLKKVGLPVVKYETIVGLSALREYCKTHTDQWIKVNRYRENSETWHHLDYTHSERMLDSMAVTFGGAKEIVTFIVQDAIKADIEIGYDGWCVDGEFPSESFQGYEKKNELYLGSLLSLKDLPEEIVIVNAKMAPILRQFGYRNWWATEIRIQDGTPYFIDPTARMPGQTAEHQLETCENLAEVVWAGAQGILIEPSFRYKFAAEATLHYDAASQDHAIAYEWKTLNIPSAALRYLKLYHYCEIDGVFHFPPHKTDEVGVCIGVGDSTDAALKDLEKHLELLKDVPVHANVAGFAALLDSIKEAEAQSMKFGGRIPKPESVFRDLGKNL